MYVPRVHNCCVKGQQETYRISSNKRPGAYFFTCLQDPAFDRDTAFIPGPALISYFEGKVDLRRFQLRRTDVVFERFLQDISNHGSDVLHLRSENTSCKAEGLSSSI